MLRTLRPYSLQVAFVLYIPLILFLDSRLTSVYPQYGLGLLTFGVLYVSTLIKRAVQPAGDTHHWLRFMLVSEAVTSDRVGFGVLSNLMPQICASKGNIPGTVPIVPGRTYLFVAKLVTSRVGQDQMFLKVYDHDQAVDQREPAVWSVIGREYRFNSRIEAIHVYNGIDCGWEIDEIRLGTSWQSVTPRR